MSDRFSKLSPRDVAITLASLGRRFDGAAKAASAEGRLVELHDAPGPDGASLRALLGDAAQVLAFLANEVDRSVGSQDPVVPAAVLDASERSFVDNPTSAGIDASVETIASVSNDASSTIEGASSDTLSRTVAIAGGGSTTPIELAREMARSGIALLGQTERHVEWLQSQV